MNTHLDDGQLRAALDHELTHTALLQHLEQCPACQARLAKMSKQLEPAARQLAFLSAEARQIPETQTSLRKFHLRYPFHSLISPKEDTKEIQMFKRLFTSSLFRMVAVATLLLTLVIAIPSTRALAGRLLSLFRVQQVTVVPVDFTGMEQLTGNSAIGRQVSTLVSNSIVVTQESGDPQPARDAADAGQKAGFAVRLPSIESPTDINVMGATGFDFTIDRGKAQALLDEAGRADLLLPGSIDGAVIHVRIPASVSATYGKCPAPSADGVPDDMNRSMGRQYPDCLIFSELPSPIVTAPSGVDVAELARIGFEFSGMSSEQAETFSQNIDWTTTLVIPIPRNAASYEQISVDGVTGTLIQRPSDDTPQFVLIWVKDGIVYAIGGLGADAQKAIDLANSLK